MNSSVEPAVGALLRELSEVLRLPTLAMDAEGACAIEWVDGPVVTLQMGPAGTDELWLLADIGAPTPDLELYRALLRGNLLWQATCGAVLSLTDDEPSHVIVSRTISWRHTDCAQLANCLEAFVNICEDWGEMLANYPEDSDDGDATENAVDDSNLRRV